MRRVLACLCAFCLALFFSPTCLAWAYYNEVASSYPASQDIPIKGKVLTPDDIPDGKYKIDATTSSYMCLLSDCTLEVDGTYMYVDFTISKAYNVIYLGTADEAAALTNSDGTDGTPYYSGDPPEGYVPHRFSIAIPYLNKTLFMATFNGGSKKLEKGVWYTREVVFASSEQIDSAAEALAASGGKWQGSDEPAASSSSASSGEGGTKITITDDSKKSKKKKSKKKGSKASSGNGSGTGSTSNSKTSSSQKSSSASSAQRSEAADEKAEEEEKSAEEAKAEEEEEEEEATVDDKPKLMGTLLGFPSETGEETRELIMGKSNELGAEDEQPPYAEIAATAGCGVAAAGFAGASVFALRRVPFAKPKPPTAGKDPKV